ncbi:BON domain-containing protein [Desertibaculum subflavum]|uniref:BON domain-containing protein n=1 Tax=Desertibaculum subflavum TaxID=2268458 RepID=UPI000E667AAA
MIGMRACLPLVAIGAVLAVPVVPNEAAARWDRSNGRSGGSQPELRVSDYRSVEHSASAGVVGPFEPETVTHIDDQAITDAVTRELLYDPAVQAVSVDVETVQGIVTLTGTTSHLLAKQRAGGIAETVRGVRAVVNRIDVAPATRFDNETLKSNVLQALRVDPATEARDFDVSVLDAGQVRLQGEVHSWAERRLAERTVAGVVGVTSIRNDIQVTYRQERADGEIEEDIRGRNRADVYIDDALITVDVEDGRVFLDGVVGSAAEKTRAVTNAWVLGVESVEAEALEVRSWARDPGLRGPKYNDRSDKEILAAAHDALLYDPRVQLYDVSVEVEGGVATLRGDVGSLVAKRAAARDVRNTVGVTSVVNRIRVRPVAAVETKVLSERVEDALARDPYLERKEIVVISEGGVINLYGTVDNFFEKATAEDVASRVAGVVDVENYLNVRDRRAPLTFEPYLDDPYPYDRDWYDYRPYRSARSDASIEEEIDTELWWSPFVDAADVNVEVELGIATLTGTVQSRSEYDAAVENAWEGGATWVDNQLVIR